MKRSKPAVRRAKATRTTKASGTARKKQVVVGVKMAAPTRKQLAALKKVFGTKALASVGVAPSAGITSQQASFRKRPRSR